MVQKKKKRWSINFIFAPQFLCKTIIALLYTKYSAWFYAIKDNLNIFLLKSCVRNRYQVCRFKKNIERDLNSNWEEFWRKREILR